jgi:alkanesulfonate monooxygenase SsuD/methylene tetrahydromethanopterin reductase-like flavin-dependent oxidoreductase (luciferase family)
VISRGRFILGVGAGWLEPEMADHGVEYRTRFQLLVEQIRAMRAIWSQEDAEFHGRYVDFDKMKAFPKPYQRLYPPIIMGGEGERAMECAAEVCDGWAPWFLEWPQGKEKIARLRQMAAEHGRDPGSLEISLFEGSIPDQKTLTEMEAAGISRLVLTLFAQNREEALPRLDHLAKVNPA